MNQDLSKKLMVINLRNGIEISIEEERAKKLVVEMEKRRFIDIDGTIINTADIVGIFTAADMEAVIRRKNGQWQDKNGNWHNKGDKVCPGCGNVIPYGKTCGYCY